MNYFVIICAAFMSISFLEAREKIKVTIYNNGPESILVALNNTPRDPLSKNSIDIGEAKNFYLPDLTPRQPYYFVVEGSGAEGKKQFTIRYEPSKKAVLLYRNGYELGSIDHQVLDNGINLAYNGSLKPSLPEASLLDL